MVNPLQTLGLALGAGFSSGLNLYATIATLGLLQRYGVIHLPPSLQVLSHPWVLGIALSLYAIEFLADKIPYVDNRLGCCAHVDPPTCGSATCLWRHRSSAGRMAVERCASRRWGRAYLAQHQGEHSCCG